jgi:3-hydroxyisobutyrate dehydrogenase
VKTLAARAAAPELTPNFVLRLMAKDLSYAIEEGARNHLNLETAAPALAEFERAIAAGYGDRDFSAVIEAMQRS